MEETTEEIWEKVDVYITRKFFVTDIIRHGPATVKAFFAGVHGNSFEYSKYIYKSQLDTAAENVGYSIIKSKLKYSRNSRMVKAVNIEDYNKIHEPVIFDSDNLDIPKEVEKTV